MLVGFPPGAEHSGPVELGSLMGIAGILETFGGLAILLVVLFHAQLVGVGGGFVGVELNGDLADVGDAQVPHINPVLAKSRGDEDGLYSREGDAAGIEILGDRRAVAIRSAVMAWDWPTPSA